MTPFVGLGVLTCLTGMLLQASGAPTGPSSTSSQSALPPIASPFDPNLEKLSTLEPLGPVTPTDRRPMPTSHPRAGWMKRVVSDWLNKGNRSESAGDFFSRLRLEQKQASDSLLVSRCRALLLAEPSLRTHFIHVSAREGVLELRGHVPSDSARRDAERIARNTPGSRSVTNSLALSNPPAIQQATYVGASLLPPILLESEAETGASVAAKSTGAGARPAVTLGMEIESVSAADRAFGTDDLAITARSERLTSLALPPVRYETIGQTVAKAPAAPEVLPSGQRIFAGTGKRAPIPAPPSNQLPPPLPPVEATPARPVSRPTGLSARDEAMSSDVAALLTRDPRAGRLTHSLRGGEVRLAGKAATPEDLYALADLLARLPGIDFVNIDGVEFGP